MDAIMVEKLQAMKRYKAAASKRSFLHSLTKCTLSIFFFGLFLSCPLWIPKANSWFTNWIFVSMPAMRVFILCPKCLFVVCNIIVMVLVNESKSPRNVKVPDIYEEYARRSTTNTTTMEVDEVVCNKKGQIQYTSLPTNMKIKERLIVRCQREIVSTRRIICDDEMKMKKEEELMEEDELEDGGDVDEEYIGLPREELNRRVEDFIAKVNDQRRMEARMLAFSGCGNDLKDQQIKGRGNCKAFSEVTNQMVNTEYAVLGP